MSKNYFVFFIGVFLLLTSCNSTRLFSKKRGFDVEKGPVYKGNKYKDKEGSKKVTSFNYQKSKWEQEHIERLKLIEDMRYNLEEMTRSLKEKDTSEKITEVDYLLISLNKEIEDLSQRLSNIDIYTAEGYEEGLKIGVKLNDLYFNRVTPANTLIKKMSVNNIKTDTDFSTGDHELSLNGKNTIDIIVSGIIREINNWNEYLGNHNEKIFNQDKIIVKIKVNGYADMQGDENSNQKLSVKRAKSVEAELRKKLKLINDKYNIYLDIKSIGLGETSIPPGVIPNGKKNDPARRVVTIVCVTGPSLLIK
jgi:outer membrane protein OmpA-like peptidoglycan-associated protein